MNVVGIIVVSDQVNFNGMEIIEIILFLIAGILIGVLQQRWVYFSKTGKHLQDLKKKDEKNKT